MTERLDRSEEPTKAAVREAVIAAARGGLRPSASPARRNPHFEEHPSFDAVSKLAGTCQDISGLVGEHGVEFILDGFLDEGMRARTLADFTRARDHLTTILEAADAQQA